MLCAQIQFQAIALRPNYPSKPSVTTHPGPRPARSGLLQTTVAADINGLIEADCSIEPNAYKETIKIIYTKAVLNHFAFRSINKVLQLPAPDIFASEADLPRHRRTTLAQL